VSFLKEDTKTLLKVIIDTNTLFSSIYSRKGNEARLLEMADEGKCVIYLLDHVILEIERVFDEKSIPKEKFQDLLDTYENIIIHELDDLKKEEIILSKALINDPGDRPIFIFAKRMIENDENTCLVSGDKIFFLDNVKNALHDKVKKTKEVIDFIG